MSMHTNERDYWWSEVREEISKSALALHCTHVLGYREEVNVHLDVVVLTAYGTAVKVKTSKQSRMQAKTLQAGFNYDPQRL